MVPTETKGLPWIVVETFQEKPKGLEAFRTLSRMKADWTVEVVEIGLLQLLIIGLERIT